MVDRDTALLRFETDRCLDLAEDILSHIPSGTYSPWELRLAVKLVLSWLDRAGYRYTNELVFEGYVRELFASSFPQAYSVQEVERAKFMTKLES